MSFVDNVRKFFKRGKENMTDYYVPKNAIIDKQKIIYSPSKKYKLIITPYKTKPGYVNNSLGEVFCDDKLLFSVKRNYDHFPYAWLEPHKNGHDYLVCGENYQGQTVLELDTNKRIDYLPKMAEVGVGFCWVDIKPSPTKEYLAVEGCIWAAPYEIIVVDFTEPMNPPWTILKRSFYDSFDGWINDDTCSFSNTYRYSFVYNKNEDDMNDEEFEHICELENNGASEEELWEYRKNEKCMFTIPSAFDCFISYTNDLKSFQDRNLRVNPDLLSLFDKYWQKLSEEEKTQIKLSKNFGSVIYAQNNVFDIKEFIDRDKK